MQIRKLLIFAQEVHTGTAFGTEEQQSVKHGNLCTKWCFIVINNTLHDSHALAVVFFCDESQRLICQLSSIYEQGSKCA